MARAIWNGAVLAESDETIIIEGNHYFPPDTIKREHFEASERTTVCSWKGTANYYEVVVDGERNPWAAWYYAEPFDAAREITGYIAFWNGVTIQP